MVEALSRKISISSDEPQALNTHSSSVDPTVRAGKAGLHVACSSIEAIFGEEAGSKLGKSDGSISAGASSQIPNCPSCGSAKIWRNGFRSQATRALAVASYSKYLSIVGGTWKAPRYQVERKIPYVPTEKEIDCLINAAYSKQSAYLLILKETGMRSSEAWFLQWKDLDFERNAITLNETLKHGTPRMFKVSAKLTATINSLPKISAKFIFQSEPPNPFGLMHFSSSFRALRRRVAAKMQNPNLNRITFHTFRHWFATNEYHKTKSLLHVQERLGHKNILTTTVYTHLINFDSDRYYSATAATVDEAVKLVEAGFEYVCDIEGFKLFRKPK